MCRQCEPYFHTVLHAMEGLDDTSERTTPGSPCGPGGFERLVRQAAPVSLTLVSGADDGPLAKIHGIGALARCDLRLRGVNRRRGCWELQYGVQASPSDDRLMCVGGGRARGPGGRRWGGSCQAPT